MFDIGATELLLVAIVALLVIGPKDLPLAMRTAGNWVGKLRAMTRHFRIGIDAMIREAEVEEQEKLWAEKNAKIMREHPPEAVGEQKKPEAKLLPEKPAETLPAPPAPPPAPPAPPPPPASGDGGSAGDSAEPDLFQSPPPAGPDTNSSGNAT